MNKSKTKLNKKSKTYKKSKISKKTKTMKGGSANATEAVKYVTPNTTFNNLPVEMNLDILYKTNPKDLIKMLFVNTKYRNLIIKNLNHIIERNIYFDYFDRLFANIDDNSIFLDLELDSSISNKNYKKFLLYCKYYEEIVKYINTPTITPTFILNTLQTMIFNKLCIQKYLSTSLIKKLETLLYNYDLNRANYLQFINNIIKLINANFSEAFFTDNNFNRINAELNASIIRSNRNFVKYAILLKQCGFSETFISNGIIRNQYQIDKLCQFKKKGFEEDVLEEDINLFIDEKSIRTFLDKHNITNI